ncbi:MAG: hypothetical protein NTY36_03960 [Deltaproteobacteria bacterium]|nr:hypothetical protein [Deltaproteobacteria bacterium]
MMSDKGKLFFRPFFDGVFCSCIWRNISTKRLTTSGRFPFRNSGWYFSADAKVFPGESEAVFPENTVKCLAGFLSDDIVFPLSF